MSLKVGNLATDKQIAILKRLEYAGTGKYAIEQLTVAEAADLITELFEEERLAKRDEHEQYGDLFDLLDPFNQLNK